MSFVCLAGWCRHYDAKGNAIMGPGAERVGWRPAIGLIQTQVALGAYTSVGWVEYC